MLIKGGPFEKGAPFYFHFLETFFQSAKNFSAPIDASGLFDHSFCLQAQDFQADGKPLDDFTNLFDQGYKISFFPGGQGGVSDKNRVAGNFSLPPHLLSTSRLI